MIRTISIMILIVHFVYRLIGDIDMELISYISLSGHLDDLMSTILHIDLKYQKGQRHKDVQKTVTLRLLPATLAMHDSLRLLVTLALVDGVFGPGATWKRLLAIDPGEL